MEADRQRAEALLRLLPDDRDRSRQILQSALVLLSEGSGLGSTASKPTRREREVLHALAVGKTYEQTSAALGISINTVRNHVRSAYDKLGVGTKSSAVAVAMRHGWI